MDRSDKQRFHAIYAAELRYVWNSLYRLGVPACDVEDVAHETLLSVYRRLADYDAARPLRPWLFGFAYRTAADYRKRMHRRHEVGVDDLQFDEPAHEGPSAEEEIARREERALVVEALRAVPIERSAVFVLMEIDGCSAPEAAEALGIPLNTVYSRIRVAREEFTAALRRVQAGRGGS
jgi:RNA polymerase sigma-70 factor (ECF subfamily)